ncbi:MAG: NTP transferase domain-containing protein [Alphaproteobacteria bacterium]|nr:NTP transferase domain-containing protein [Alphaproteobacteria bacterium]
MSREIGAIILGAGKGTRMKSDLPKVLMPVDNKPMIRHIIDTLEELKVKKIVTVIAPDGEAVKREVAPYPTCIQEKQLGTGHAVLSACDHFRGFTGDILVIFGDQPLYTKESMKKMLKKRAEGFSVVCMGFRPDDPARYGRLIMDGEELKRIVEFKDATDEEKKINFCNSGIMCFEGEKLFSILSAISNDNAAQEYYLTDAVEIALRMGLKCSAVECPVDEASAANTLEELALLEELIKKRKSQN